MSRLVAFQWFLSARGSARAKLAAAGLAILMLTCISGCGWIFGKQEKPMHVQVSLTGSADLNFDGKNAQSVQVKVFLLRNSARFMGADLLVFFDPTYHEQLAASLGKDILDSGSVILSPQETGSLDLEVPFVKVEKEKPVLCAVANFYRPPGQKRERWSVNISKKTYQKVKLEVGKDWVKKAGK